MSRSFDAMIIGAGQGEPFFALRLAEAGMNVAIIERKLLGGACVNSGCTPAKNLVARARATHLACARRRRPRRAGSKRHSTSRSPF